MYTSYNYNNNYYYSKEYYNKKRYNNYEKWSQIAYPGETQPYIGVEPNTGYWTMNYFDWYNGELIDKLGNKIKLDIKDPKQVDFNEELEVVQKAQNNITEEQKKIAEYWAKSVPIETIAPIALALIKTYGVNPPRSSRIMSILTKGINDAFVLTWYLKYKWDVARPIQLDQELNPYSTTPQFPAYPSGHSVISGAAAEIMSYYFPQEREKLMKIAEEASISRLFGGVHFPSDLTEGIKLGKQIGRIVIEQASQEKESNTGNYIDIPEKNFLDAPINPKY